MNDTQTRGVLACIIVSVACFTTFNALAWSVHYDRIERFKETERTPNEEDDTAVPGKRKVKVPPLVANDWRVAKRLHEAKEDNPGLKSVFEGLTWLGETPCPVLAGVGFLGLLYCRRWCLAVFWTAAALSAHYI